ncbi:related to LCCL domain protein [Cephalotrichum gorgonifer]|uniref:Related to LCCL domain protein n=1 Tax=Cephalotrichum gorgonifer TaxID=2041049 RepID=A0AAE8N3U3_9PEZI|nr:related to LCCL domain protein [Cephalotrichum gorgonifer]
MADAGGRLERQSSDTTRSSTSEDARLLPTEQFEIEEPPSPGPSTNSPHPPGPPPKRHTITPILPSIQHLPIDLIQRLFPTRTSKRAAAASLLLLWLAAFFTPLILSTRPVRDSAGEYAINLSCVDTLFPRNSCGIDGTSCAPFANLSVPFRCPANCAPVSVLEPRPVGPQDVVYRPLVVGGQPHYRGDSFVCGAAIHAGIVSDAHGGCGRLTRVGERDSFPASDRNGISSIAFPSYFPLAYTVTEDPSIPCPRSDVWRLLALLATPTLTVLATLFSTSAPFTFASVFATIFAHTAFVSDPPGTSRHSLSVLPDLVSLFARRLLPASFCAAVIYRLSARRTLEGLTAQLEKVALWLAGFWFGATSNYTLDHIPIQRLTPHDLEQQPGAKAALAAIVAVLALAAGGQAWHLRAEGRLPLFARGYGALGALLLVFVLLPGVSLRLHHYVLALLLLPATGMQTRPSLLYQGFLLGLFVNGVARWGFDSVLQTTGELRNDGAFGSPVPEVLSVVVVPGNGSDNSIAFSLGGETRGADGISAVVNDVERYRAFFADGPEWANFTWEGRGGGQMDEYFRFAFISDGMVLDFSGTGTWLANGTYIAPEPK